MTLRPTDSLLAHKRNRAKARRHQKKLEEGGAPKAKRAKPVRYEEIIQRYIVANVLKPIEHYSRISDGVPSLKYFHVPNQLLRSSALCKIYAPLGVRAGVPDLVVMIRGGAVLWIELKGPEGGASDDQSEFHKDLEAMGFTVHVLQANSQEEGRQKMIEILRPYGVLLRGME